MKVELQLVSTPFLTPLESGEFVLPPGSTIADLLDAAIERFGEPDPRALNFLLFLQNGAPAQRETGLLPDGLVHVTRALVGG